MIARARAGRGSGAKITVVCKRGGTGFDGVIAQSVCQAEAISRAGAHAE